MCDFAMDNFTAAAAAHAIMKMLLPAVPCLGVSDIRLGPAASLLEHIV